MIKKYKFYNNGKIMARVHEEIKETLSADAMAHFITCKILGADVDELVQESLDRILEEL